MSGSGAAPNYCPSCGAEVNPDDTYCAACGAQVAGERDHIDEPIDTDWAESTSSDTTRETMFYIGAVLAVIGVVALPFFFVFIALPEAILAFWGKSTVSALPSDARDNPAVKGSFLIFRWFGNFLLLVLVLGIVALLVLVL